MPIIVLAGTMDSKGLEYAFIRKKILDNYPDCQVFVIDIAYIQDPDPDIIVPDIRAVEVTLKGGCDSIDTLRKGTRADGYKVMTIGLVEIVKNLHSEGKLHGILGLGGTCGSAMLTAAMRALPIGTPKVMVSTMAATETGREYFGISDLTLVNCLTDISGGVNRFNEGTLSNAAVSIASMTINYYRRTNDATSTKTHDSTNKKLVGISMFGATMPGVTAAQKRLIEHGYDTVIFCAVGTGGRMIENLCSTGEIDGVLDMTLFEISNNFNGGIHEAGPNRLEQACLKGIPQVVSLGGLDIVAFGPFPTVPEKHKNRKLLMHNQHVTPIRLVAEESKQLGELVAKKLNKAKGPCKLFIPHGGLSIFTVPGGPFHDPSVEEALFEALKANLDTSVVEVIDMEQSINDPIFGSTLADAMHEMLQKKK